MNAGMARRDLCALGVALGLLAACDRGKDSGFSATPAASASASRVVPVGVTSGVALEQVKAQTAACRALRVEGVALVGDAPLGSGALLDGEAWVSVPKSGSVALKHTSSGRELTVAGPALFRACRRGREQLLLAKGNVKAGGGMGARPGAEVLIATPVAALRYGEAEFNLALDEHQLTLNVVAGRVELDAQSPKQGRPVKSPLQAGDKLSLAVGKPDPDALIAACKASAEAAETSARRVADRNASEPLGERAQAHVKARKAARVTCTVAAAATGLVADSALRAGLWADALRWEGLWETIPRR